MLARPYPQTPAYPAPLSRGAPAHGVSRPARSSGRGQKIALVAAALLCGWTLYADPVARARAAFVLSPLLGVASPAEPAIRIGDTHARRTEIDGRTILYVEGELRNTGKRRLKTPTLLVTLIGEDDRPLYAWKTKPTRAELRASQEVAFQTRLLSPPEKFKRIAITVAEGG
jgi:hypothetical protein